MPLRVLTYNILTGGEDRLPLILDVIRAQNPDVVALQEADRTGATDELAAALGMCVVYGEGPTRFANAWISRLPIRHATSHRAQGMRKSLLEIEVELDGAPIHLFAAHLRPKLSGEPRRVIEVEAILGILRAVADRPHLLVGDLNSLHSADNFLLEPTHPPRAAEWVRLAYETPRLVLSRLLAAGYVDCYRQLHADTTGYTFATRFPMTRIDFVLASPQIAPRLCACETITTPPANAASDHFPVVADFA